MGTVPSPAPSLSHLPARTWVEIDLAALRHNARAAQACLATPELGIIAVVKANGYGLGMVPVARALTGLVRAFAVANFAEAFTLRDAGIMAPIYLLGPALPDEWSAIAAAGFCPAISNLTEAAGFAAAAQTTGQALAVHVVVDTGMGRIGAMPEEAAALISAVLASPWLRLDSIASHYPSADGDPAFTREQASRFSHLLEELRAAGSALPHSHLSNSAGLTSYPTVGWGRAGLMLYGVSPMDDAQALLQTVVSWKTRVTLVKHLPTGHGVSYGRTWRTPHPTRTAVLAVGYADGYPRQASGREAAVLIGGQRCPVLGRITMDQIITDTTALVTPPQPGDEAVLIGSQGQQEITAGELATWGQTIPWDIFTGLGPRVQRCYSNFIF